VKLSEVKFDLSPVKEKPGRKYRKGSKYDPVIDKFLEGKNKLVSIEISGREANYIRTQLKKRVDARKLSEKVDVSVVNNKAYLEKL
jgi:hypothetical protein